MNTLVRKILNYKIFTNTRKEISTQFSKIMATLNSDSMFTEHVLNRTMSSFTPRNVGKLIIHLEKIWQDTLF
jgi:D-Tyr-tRNAtyr deacylase